MARMVLESSRFASGVIGIVSHSWLEDPDPLPGPDLLHEAFTDTRDERLDLGLSRHLAIANAEVDLDDDRPRTLAQDLVQPFVRSLLGPPDRDLERLFQVLTTPEQRPPPSWSSRLPLTAAAPCVPDRP